MYGKAQIDRLNGVNSSSSQEPVQLSAKLVSSGVVIASRTEADLPRVGLTPPDGYTPVGEPAKIQLHSDINGDSSLTLAQAREWLAARYEEDPSLYFGIANKGQDWGHLQAYRKL